MTPLTATLLPVATLVLAVSVSVSASGSAPTPAASADRATLGDGRGTPSSASPPSPGDGEQLLQLPQRASSPSDAPDPASTPGTSGPSSRWAWPLDAPHPVVRPFVAPASRYGPGHRGLDVAGMPRASVRAVDAGTVSHVGVVAGRGTLTVLHPNGLRSTYEPVTGSVKVGQVVRRGQTIATLIVDGNHCAPRLCLHLGAVSDTTYLDPLALLSETSVRLLPLRQPRDTRAP